jgi:hypothetical protein
MLSLMASSIAWAFLNQPSIIASASGATLSDAPARAVLARIGDNAASLLAKRL